MTVILADRVRETTTVTSTGPATLLGAVTGYQAFSVIGSGGLTYYTIADQSGPNWEVGIGTYSSTGPTLTRTTILASSNGGAAVNFSSGTKDVFLTQPAEKAVTTQSFYTPDTFAGTFTDGIALDYTTGTGRISVGSGDGITFYTGGVANTSIGSVSSAGAWSFPSLTLSGGTANGVLYLNGSKAVTSGSALTFDGTNLGLNTTSLGTFNRGIYVNSGAGAYAGIQLYNTAYPSGAYVSITNADLNIVNANATGNTIFLINSAEQMRLTSTGLGIGTSSPGSKLQVNEANRANGTNVANFQVFTTDTATQDFGGSLALGGNFNSTSGVAPFASIRGAKENATNNNYSGYLQFNTIANGGVLTEKMRLDSSGNLGLGVTPSGWGSSNRAIDISAFCSIAQTSSGSLGSTFNAYLNSSGNWIYKTTNPASQYQVGLAGTAAHAWYTAPSGTAGNAITFTQAMTLDASGNLGVGTASPNGRISAVGTDTGGSLARIDSFNGTVRTELISYAGLGYVGTVTNHPLVFETNGTEKVRIDSSGNVCIGTTSSSGGFKLNVNGYLQAGGLTPNAAGSNIFNSNLVLNATTNWNYSNLDIKRNASNTSQNRFVGFELDGDAVDSTTIGAYGGIWGFYNGTPTTGSTSSSLQAAIGYAAYYGHRWYVNGAETARIDSSGNLLVGTTINNGVVTSYTNSATGRAGFFMVNAASSLAYDALGVSKYDNNTTTSQVFVKFFINNNAAASGLITANGANAATFTSSSDKRLKDNIIELPSQLNNILALKPSEFDYKDGTGHQIGFIAQDMEQVYPDCVAEDGEGMLMISGWSKTEARLVKAIQELSAKVAELESKLN